MTPQSTLLEATLRQRSTSKTLWPEQFCTDCLDALVSFLFECCWTYNDDGDKIERIPDMAYIRELAQAWFETRAEARPLIIEKSRRMLASWILRGCELWSLGLARERCLVVGLDREAAANQVWRIWWLHSQLRFCRPQFDLEPCSPRRLDAAARRLRRITFRNGSSVQAASQRSFREIGPGVSCVTLEDLSSYRDCTSAFAYARGLTEGSHGHVVVCTGARPNKAWQQIKACPPDLLSACTLPLAACPPDSLSA